MNKVIQYFFLILIPLYPFWASIIYTLTKRNADIFTFAAFLPVVAYLLMTQKIRIPKYLIFLALFALYHFVSVYVNDLIPPQMNPVFFLFADENMLACLAFFAVENTLFDDKFITKMNRMVLLLVAATLTVSLIQIRFNTFFISPEIRDNPLNYIYFQQHRNFSVFSWININSLGLTFPILISLLLAAPGMSKGSFPLVLLSGMVVSFLSKARYIMISVIIAISQMFFVKKLELSKKIYILLIIVAMGGALVVLGNVYELNLNQVISDRILERRTGMGSARARIASLEVFLQVFPDHPWFGVGPQTGQNVLQLLRGVARSIHVGYLSYLYFYGIFGASLVFISIFYLIRDSWRVGKKMNFWGSFYGFMTLCFANVTFVYFNFSEIGIILAVIYLKYYKDKMEEEAGEEAIPAKITADE